MPRPCKMRRVACNPLAMNFVPGSTPSSETERVLLTRDELESLRLADYEGLYQEDAAKRMKISRQTFGNIVASAHKKVADFLVNSKCLSIEGGNIEIDVCRFSCTDCGHAWQVLRGRERPERCPRCGGSDIHCSKRDTAQSPHHCWRNR